MTVNFKNSTTVRGARVFWQLQEEGNTLLEHVERGLAPRTSVKTRASSQQAVARATAGGGRGSHLQQQIEAQAAAAAAAAASSPLPKMFEEAYYILLHTT